MKYPVGTLLKLDNENTPCRIKEVKDDISTKAMWRTGKNSRHIFNKILEYISKII